MSVVAKMLIVVGVLSVLAGVLLLVVERAGLGGLPGDLVWRKGSFTLYVPLGLIIVLSLVLTLLLHLFFRR